MSASQPILFAESLANKIKDMTGIKAEVSIVPQLDIGSDDDLHVFVVPAALTTEIESRDSILETIAAQILICKYIKSTDTNSADAVFSTVGDIQYNLIGESIEITNQCPYFIQQVREYGSTFVGSSSQMDGLFDTEAVDESYVLKCPLVIEALRRISR